MGGRGEEGSWGLRNLAKTLDIQLYHTVAVQVQVQVHFGKKKGHRRARNTKSIRPSFSGPAKCMCRVCVQIMVRAIPTTVPNYICTYRYTYIYAAILGMYIVKQGYQGDVKVPM